MWLIHKKKELTEKSIPEEAQTLDIPDEEFKLTAFYMLKLLMESMDKELKEIRRMMYGQMGTFKKEVEIIKMNQIEIL